MTERDFEVELDYVPGRTQFRTTIPTTPTSPTHDGRKPVTEKLVAGGPHPL